MNRLIVILSSLAVVAVAWVLWDSTPSSEAIAKSLDHAYEAKLANPEYVTWKSLPGLPSTYQNFAEEKDIKKTRSQLASRVSASEGLIPETIPTYSGSPPTIDGRIEPSEWKMATSIPIGLDDSNTRLFLISEGKRLYVACDVPADTTGKGYDQFRFYFHVGLTPLIVNERIHVGTRTDDRLGGIRQTTVRWKGAPPKNDDERWMKYPISDWQIFEQARGLSTIREHRQYEAVLDLEEAGIHPGVPFGAFVQVETDPALDDRGKFDHRVYVGQYGTQANPRWFLIEKSGGAGEP